MDSVRFSVYPRLRFHIMRFLFAFSGIYYCFVALSSIPSKGYHLYQFWIPKSLWLKKLLLPVLKYNISHSALQNLIYVAMATFIGYALYYILLTKMESFSLTNKYVEYSHGIISRSHDTVDMIIVKDQVMKQTLFELILGLATIKIVSSDLSHPELKIWGLSKKDANQVLEHLRTFTIKNYTDYRLTQDMKKPRTKKPGYLEDIESEET